MAGSGPGEVSRVDLHIHSRYSVRPATWFLQKIGSPESYADSADVYALAKAHGMDFVTITDHDSIEGALQIAHHEDAFVSEEITTTFPEDRCKVHICLWDITEQQHREAHRLSPNIFELKRYLKEEGIHHAVAHALYSINRRLTAGHFEKLLLMFKVFEFRNGYRDKLSNEVLSEILQSLTPELIEDMANRYGIEPDMDEPWVKFQTAGSDDHSCTFIGRTYTETPRARTIREFLDHVTQGRGRAGGEHGSSQKFAYNTYKVSYLYHLSQSREEGKQPNPLVEAALKAIFDNEPAPPSRASVPPQARVETFKDRLNREVKDLRKDLSKEPPRERSAELRAYDWIDKLSGRIVGGYVEDTIRRAFKGDLVGAGASFGNLAPVFVALLPYFQAYRFIHNDRPLLDHILKNYTGRSLIERNEPIRRGWFSDTVVDLTGVVVTIRNMSRAAAGLGLELTVCTSGTRRVEDFPGQLKVFEPMFEINLPDYELIKLPFPSPLEVIRFCEEQEFDEVIVSTQGFVGLMGILAGKMLRLPVSGIYHSDVPQHVAYNTGDEAMEAASWRYMEWFYGQMDHIYVNSEAYIDQLEEHGFARSKMSIFPRGTDAELFHPRFRDPAFLRSKGVPDATNLLYVGRVARDKNLDFLLDCFRELLAAGLDVNLVVVGDGPYLADFRLRCEGERVFFLGYLDGEELSRAYASSDVFVFPSTTDTYGNVVLEAQASGLPVVVSNVGGPKEIIRRDVSGFVTNVDETAEFVSHVHALIDSPRLRDSMGREGRRLAERRTWKNAMERFWQWRH
jgi:glycosyltransferase involved in cell wall biosynthesis